MTPLSCILRDVGFEGLPPVPITHGGVVDPAHAVGRDADVVEVLGALSGGESVALPGERRHGKTVLSRIVEERGRAQMGSSSRMSSR